MKKGWLSRRWHDSTREDMNKYEITSDMTEKQAVVELEGKDWLAKMCRRERKNYTK